jgi:hypothetical protein
METGKRGIKGKIWVALTFVIMVGVNYLANALPINGLNTGAVSDSYKNLFAPAGITFAIWGLIYLLLLLYTVYQFGAFQPKDSDRSALFEKVGGLFATSSLANAAWIYSWHYKYIILSAVLMAVILVCLIKISGIIYKETLTKREKIFIRLPFSVYFGWITVATIANITVLLVSLKWDGFGYSESLWTMAVLATGMLIGAVTMIRRMDMAYGFVLIWAYSGILLKHLSQSGFAGKYPDIITAVIGCLVAFLGCELFIIFYKKIKHPAA